MTHYKTLGVSETATPDEIKRAYRKLASQHHPDKGGDTAQFQAIQSAYDVLQDPAKREQYDHERRNPGGFRFNVNGHDVNGMPPHVADMFKNFGFNFGGFPGGDPFGHMRQPRRNKDIRVEVPVTLASTLADQKKTVSIQNANGERQTVEVDIPRGVTNGTQIKYPGLGDNFFNTLERGDLFVVVLLQPHPNFEINGLDVVTTVRVDCLRAITGGEIEVEGIEGNRFVVNLPQSTQPDMVLRIKDQGIWQIHGSTRGNLYVKIALTVPRNLTTEQLATICEIQSTL
jgi:DnaJ-class molecular chaperone